MKKPISNSLLLITFFFLTSCFTETQIQAQNETEPIATHYVFPDFVKGSVKMKNGITEEAVMDYNMLTEEMVFEKNGTKLDLKNTNDLITLINKCNELVR